MTYPDFSIHDKGNSRMLHGKGKDLKQFVDNRKRDEVIEWMYSEEDESQPSKIMEYYQVNVEGFSLEDTCLVIGMIVGCLKNDNYEEADLIARAYLGLAEFQKWEDYKHRQDTESGPMHEYPADSHAYAVCQLLNVVLVNLKGDDPKVIEATTVCESFFAELLEEEEQNG